MELDFIAKAAPRPKGNYYQDFEVGQLFDHHWGRTINAGDNSLFTTLLLDFNPLYFNQTYARQHDHCDVVVNPSLVFNTVFGLSVEDLSEAGGLFLGVDQLNYHCSVYPNDTLTACSEVLSKRESAKNPQFGVVSWHTKGFNQHSDIVVDFVRTNFVKKREA